VPNSPEGGRCPFHLDPLRTSDQARLSRPILGCSGHSLGDLDLPFFVGRNRYRPYRHGWPLTVAIHILACSGRPSLLADDEAPSVSA
jgi:hypothetical protein